MLSGILEINEVGDSTYVDWGDPDRFFGGIALFKADKNIIMISIMQSYMINLIEENNSHLIIIFEIICDKIFNIYFKIIN